MAERDWVADADEPGIEFSCKFTKNNAFMIRSFSTEPKNGSPMSGMQVVAWDPAQSILRSCMFDSDGGFGEVAWSQSGNRYSIRTKYTLPDGGIASAIKFGGIPAIDTPMHIAVARIAVTWLVDTATIIHGVLAGTYYNETTDVSRPLKGNIDQESQRAVMGFADGDNPDIALEMGMFNLTQDEAPGLLHLGTDDSTPVLLVRLTDPDAESE